MLIQVIITAYLEAKAQMDTGKPEQALVILDRALKTDPDNAALKFGGFPRIKFCLFQRPVFHVEQRFSVDRPKAANWTSPTVLPGLSPPTDREPTLLAFPPSPTP